MELPWLRCPEPLCGEGVGGTRRRSRGLAPGWGRCHPWGPSPGAAPQGDAGTAGPGLRLLAEPPQPSTKLPAASGTGWSTGAPGAVPLSPPPWCRPPEQRRQRGPWPHRGGREGKGMSTGVCVCARGCVCVHILTAGLSPRLAGPRGGDGGGYVSLGGLRGGGRPQGKCNALSERFIT